MGGAPKPPGLTAPGLPSHLSMLPARLGILKPVASFYAARFNAR